ncbi:unnamed protein product [Linum trigynum]|uniref:Protein RDM1 n=1 Tax=Linum trigynum TaxID=586398 RepID=A0AAV2FG71_9ROSI
MKRPIPCDVISDDSSDAENDGEEDGVFDPQQHQQFFNQHELELDSPEMITKTAEMYQNYMQELPIPSLRGSVIPCSSWMELGRSMKQLYGQPLHYLTNIILKRWDQLRTGTENQHQPLDLIIHPSKAEATIWLVEEVHRKTSSHLHIAQLWISDPMHQRFVDGIVPELCTPNS